jgi:hypothetical protein
MLVKTYINYRPPLNYWLVGPVLIKQGSAKVAVGSQKYQTGVSINLLQTEFWKITEDFRCSGIINFDIFFVNI